MVLTKLNYRYENLNEVYENLRSDLRKSYKATRRKHFEILYEITKLCTLPFKKLKRLGKFSLKTFS